MQQPDADVKERDMRGCEKGRDQNRRGSTFKNYGCFCNKNKRAIGTLLNPHFFPCIRIRVKQEIPIAKDVNPKKSIFSFILGDFFINFKVITNPSNEMGTFIKNM